jgi:hypothetical protein
MARRGTNHFRLNDARRAIRTARREGIEPAIIEIVAKDGTTFRIHGPKASSTPSEAEKQLDDELTKLREEKSEKVSRSAPTRR